jgi:hypothetical protein
VSDDRDSGRLSPVEYRFERLGVVWHDTDGADFLGDEILDCAHLLSRVGCGRSNHVSFHVFVCASFLDALFHSGEPWDTADLNHDGNLQFRGSELCVEG